MRYQLNKVYHRLARSVVESAEYARPKIFAFGVLGVVAILLGIFFLANTLVSAVFLVYMTAILAIFGGIFAVIMAFRLR